MRLLFSLVISTLTLPLLAAEHGELLVKVQGVKSDKGQIVVTVYKDGESWLKKNLSLESQTIPASGKDISVQFRLQAGSYAIQVYQDENSNGKLDMKWFPPGPAEPWVVSNNAQGTMGPPAYKDAKIELQGDLTLSMQLQ